ncbi:MAG TPA: selenide, water dikinase SelD [Spirochaetales bacterium]|nr:selenide, water dikinase SelD [Spirochaetales bacterium]HRY56110.1 selenide, water dikinase SelD [Spirochaetia bacterium]HRZ65348.1 selenide, water dikinase SelD [Spirochaetia bacterium]
MSEGPVRMTSYTKFSGCGAKLGPGVLEKALCGLSQPAYPEILADFANCEDAGLYDLGDGRALVQTVDFFPPIVDDPFGFGRIAAANALSDVYAMGGRPISALALVCFPVGTIGLEALRSGLAGGLDALVEAGCALLGGHSIDDPEPKLGYAVTGLVDAERAWRNNTPRPGAALILTKALGTGLITRALKEGRASEASRLAAERSMSRLNKAACEALSRFRVLACTDVTGFGLAGHAAEMASGPACGLRISFSQLPLLPGAAECAAAGLAPGGTKRNKEGRGQAVKADPALGPAELDLVFDPQTSGGLLAAVEARDADAALAELRAAGCEAALIGEAGGEPGIVEIGP